MLMTLMCTGCEGSSTFTKTSNVGVMAKNAGNWHPIFTHDTDLVWLCPVCFEICVVHAEAILRYVKDEQIYFPSLLRKRK